MNAYEQAPEDLKFIVRNLEEWPSDEVTNVFVLRTHSKICFRGGNTSEFNFYTRKESIPESDDIYTNPYKRKEYETAREAYIKMNYKPEVGDLVDLEWIDGVVIKGAKVKYISQTAVVFDNKGEEDLTRLGFVKIMPHSPEPTIQELMLEDVNKNIGGALESYDVIQIGTMASILEKEGWHK